MPKIITLTGLILKNFQEQLYETAFSISKEKLIHKLMESLRNLHFVFPWTVCFHVLFQCFHKFKPAYHRRYVDDILVLFRSPDDLEKFKNYLNYKHRNIRFTCEKEHNNSMHLLDVLITRTSNCFKTYMYHKPTFCGVYFQISTVSFPKNIKLVWFSLYYFERFQFFRTFQILFRSMSFKEILKKNTFPIKLIDSCIKNLVNKKLTEKPVSLTAEKKDLVIVL